MTKELEEAKEWIQERIVYIAENCDFNDSDNKRAYDNLKTLLNYIDNSISKEVIEEKYQEAENEVIKIREENIKNNNATKYDYLKVGKRDAYKELLEGK